MLISTCIITRLHDYTILFDGVDWRSQWSRSKIRGATLRGVHAWCPCLRREPFHEHVSTKWEFGLPELYKSTGLFTRSFVGMREAL